MFRLALRTFKADIRAIFQGWGMWILLIIIALLIGVVPMVGDDVEGSYWGGMAYAIGMSFLWMTPRFTRVFHVVPFHIEQIKKLAIYRCIVLLGATILMGGIFLALAYTFSWNWNPGFGLWYFFYVELYFVFLRERLAGFHKKKYKLPTWLIIWTMVLMIASGLMMLGIAVKLPVYVQYLIQTGVFLFFLPFPVTLFRNMEFFDYCQVRESIGARPSFLE